MDYSLHFNLAYDLINSRSKLFKLWKRLGKIKVNRKYIDKFYIGYEEFEKRT